VKGFKDSVGTDEAGEDKAAEADTSVKKESDKPEG
jgi:hypothetical protein